MTEERVEETAQEDVTRAEDATGSGAEAASTETADDEIVEQVRVALREVTDPELGINIVDLGLVYDIDVDEGAAQVTMTLTSPGCPAGGQILGGAKDAAESVEGIEEAVVSLVWKPFWTPERIDPEVRAMLGF
ncbi:MAG: metal-sulfur cluster assembly factor [Gemmatimonadota bacterium]|nr:metal-sulfur cluster assembly factor [Gemmatimonadota bacterium]